MRLFYKNSLLLIITLLITACGSLGEDNSPKPTAVPIFTPLTTLSKVWSLQVGHQNNNLRFMLALYQNRLITTNAKGLVMATDINQGAPVWRIDLKTNITSGVGVGEGFVAVVGADARLYVLAAQTGKVCWQAPLTNQVLGVPTIAQDKILIKTVNDDVIAFDAHSGKQCWIFLSDAPQLVLHISSSPVVINDTVVIGLSSGKVVALKLVDGTPLWEQTIAAPKGVTDVQQMVDIAVNPVIENGIIYVVSYQGNIAALRLANGTLLWQRALSAYTGIAVSPDNLFITDADSHLWLLQKTDGSVVWQQAGLAYWNVTAPVLTSAYVIEGDSRGWLSMLSRKTGDFVARVKVSNSAIITVPLVKDNHVYVLTQDGTLVDYKIG